MGLVNDVTFGDCRDLSRYIPGNCIDLIFTDPPYHDDSMWVWEWLAETAARVLRPGHFMFSYAGKHRINEIYKAFDKYLVYWWTACGYQPDNNTRYWSRGVLEAWRPVLIYVKPPLPKVNKNLPTLLDARRMNRDKRYHQWGQGEDFAVAHLEKFTKPHDLIFDPFCGGGTTAAAAKRIERNYITFDNDEATTFIARSRINATQVEDITVFAEQLKMFD